MKTIILSLFAIVAIQGSAFAEVSCRSEITEKALEKASSQGFESCKVDEVRPDEATNGSGEQGQVQLSCRHHISQVSVVTEFVTYDYSVPKFDTVEALNCSNASVEDSNQQ
jgi:hypothetical protein